MGPFVNEYFHGKIDSFLKWPNSDYLVPYDVPTANAVQHDNLGELGPKSYARSWLFNDKFLYPRQAARHLWRGKFIPPFAILIGT